MIQVLNSPPFRLLRPRGSTLLSEQVIPDGREVTESDDAVGFNRYPDEEQRRHRRSSAETYEAEFGNTRRERSWAPSPRL